MLAIRNQVLYHIRWPRPQSRGPIQALLSDTMEQKTWPKRDTSITFTWIPEITSHLWFAVI